MLPEVPTVVLSSQDVYQAQSDLRSGAIVAAVSLTEDSALRRERYPHKGLGLPVVLDDYEKLDVEERWRTRRAVVLRLPAGCCDHREDPRIVTGTLRVPMVARPSTCS